MFAHYADVLGRQRFAFSRVSQNKRPRLIFNDRILKYIIQLITQLTAEDGHCAFLIARLNSNPSEEGKKRGFAFHRVQTDRSGHLLIQSLENFHTQKAPLSRYHSPNHGV